MELQVTKTSLYLADSGGNARIARPIPSKSKKKPDSFHCDHNLQAMAAILLRTLDRRLVSPDVVESFGGIDCHDENTSG